jgi:hypothetical protein
VSRPASCAEAALYELCVKYGYCLGADKTEALLADVPKDVDAFVDAVLAAESIEPSLADRQTRVQLRDVVADWLFDHGRGRGTKSGLPRLPP